jgi:tetratricopeptide (TPR) repeat protein
MKKQLAQALAILVMLFVFGYLAAQDSLKNDIRIKARQYFVNKNYGEALPLYQELLTSYPKEPDYLLHTGVCLIQLNRDLQQAVALLRSASISSDDPLVWYYLGRAHHLNYSFDEAIKAYSRFLLLGKGADIKNLGVERQIEMAKNGLEFTHTGRSLQVMNSRIILGEEMPRAAEINGTGKLMKKPLEFCSKSDIKADYRPWMFFPMFTPVNEYVFFSGLEKGGKNKKQLFRVKNLNHETWGIPEPLTDAINTPYDEEFPYYDPKSSVLYFSSKGHSSMGGYDIFKSLYDWNTKTWSKPENMGYPINSPFDDIVFITDEFNHSASFASDRSTGPGEVTVYRIKINPDTLDIRYASVEDIRNASQLKPPSSGNAGSALTENPTVAPAVIPVTGASGSAMAEKTRQPKSEYSKTLTEALLLQLRADSLVRITRDKRILAKETPDAEYKKQLVSEIIQSEKEAKASQRQADQKFTEARKLKSDYQTSDEANALITTAESLPVPVGNKPAGVDEFALLERSPYNESNPIPLGLAVFPGLVYRIQIGVFSKTKPNDAFGGITPMLCEQINGNGVYKYYAGLFYSMNAVNRALEQVRSHGFPDAFIVAFQDGKLISTEKAREIEFAGFKL